MIRRAGNRKSDQRRAWTMDAFYCETVFDVWLDLSAQPRLAS